MGELSKNFLTKAVSTGGQFFVELPFLPSMLELRNLTAATTPTAAFVPFARWDRNMAVGSAYYETYQATTLALTSGIFATGGVTPYEAALPMLGGFQQVASITKASPALVTSGANHGLVTGDVVVFQGLYQSTTTGMPQICGMPFVVTVTAPTTFTIAWNTNQTNYTAISASPVGAGFKKVMVPYLYVPGVSYISAITLGATTTITTTAAHNFVVGQAVGFRIPTLYGTTELNTLPNDTVPGSSVYYYVQSVVSPTSVIVNAMSTGFTAFTNNVTVAKTPGLNFPQIYAVGTVNQGGWPYTGGDLFPSPIVGGVFTSFGPATPGAFITNTRQGVLLGASIAGALNDVLSIEARLSE